MIKTIIKEILESLYRNFNLLLNRTDYSNKHIRNLDNEGISIIENFLTREQCKNYIKIIDDLLQDQNTNVWSDNEGSDKRIYFVNQINEDMLDFYNNIEIRNYLKNYLGISEPAGMLLASKVSYKIDNVGSGGGWHRDSPIKHQFKAICYLNDVDENNGCFQYIKKSHNKIEVLKSYFSKLFNFGQYRFSINEVNKYCADNNKNVSSITGSSGDLVLVDTKGIHRGKPLEKNDRYVLFCYFWDKKIPEHFESLKQK